MKQLWRGSPPIAGISGSRAADRNAAGVIALVVSALGAACGGGTSSHGGTYSTPIPIGAATDASSSRADGGLVEPTDTPALAALLKDGRLYGWIHGAVEAGGLYVFTYRKPGDFFDFAEFPLVPASADVTAQLALVKRHDAVLVKGTFIEKGAPIRHIMLENVSIVTPYVADEVAPPRTRETAIPDDLVGQTEAIAKVHAVDADGRILVIEYGDAVVPVFAQVPALTAGLYRNDKIRLAFQFAVVPPRPTHLWLDTANTMPIEVLERLVDYQDKPFQADGALVRFPLSPEIVSDVYAVQVVDSDGITREYTLLNNDPKIFTLIHDKLGAAWKSHPGQAIDGRNKLINPHIHIHASGTFNLSVPNQANAQILLDGPDNVTITFLP